jgi:acetyl-CoA acyltransferase
VSAVRTPVGKHGGALSGVRPDDLAAIVLREACERAGIPPGDVEDVYLGCANGAGEDNRNVARMAALLAGFPETVGGTTVNRLCGSGLDAVAGAARAIMLGEADVFLAGGVESMSRAPWVMTKPDRAFPTGTPAVFDSTLGWRFINPRMEAMGHTDSLGMTAENLARDWRALPAEGTDDPEQYRISREEQDRYALNSHRKAVAAMDAGSFQDEIVPVPVQTRKSSTYVDSDEGPRRDTNLTQLAALKPAFASDGTVTAGNSSSLNDGAAVVALTSGEYARENHLQPLARIRSMATAGVPPRVMGIGPVPATRKALDRAGLCLDEVGLIEVNEAFAAQVLAVCRAWGLVPDDPRLNPNGGAIALGHPLGASGARILTTLVHEMQRQPRVQFGLATMCIGVGQGISMVVERSPSGASQSMML